MDYCTTLLRFGFIWLVFVATVYSRLNNAHFKVLNMINRTIASAVILMVTYGACIAQKHSAKTFAITYEIENTEKGPGRMINYGWLVQTAPLTFTDTELEEINRKFLVIPGPFTSPAPNEKLGREEWDIIFETSGIKIVSNTDKAVSDLKPDDEVFRYTATSKISIKDNENGTIIFEKQLAKPGDERVMLLRDLFTAPRWKMMVNGSDNGLATSATEILQDKPRTVFYNLADQARETLLYAFNGTRETIYVSIFSVKGKPYSEVQDAQEKIFDAYSKFHALSKKNRIPKSEMDEVFRSAIPVWEKYAGDNSLEEKAKKGMLLNCIVAYSWLGEFDKARSYVNQVPEAQTMADAKSQEDFSGGTVGATIFLSFDQSAEGAQILYNTFRKVYPIMKINQ